MRQRVIRTISIIMSVIFVVSSLGCGESKQPAVEDSTVAESANNSVVNNEQTDGMQQSDALVEKTEENKKEEAQDKVEEGEEAQKKAEEEAKKKEEEEAQKKAEEEAKKKEEEEAQKKAEEEAKKKEEEEAQKKAEEEAKKKEEEAKKKAEEEAKKKAEEEEKKKAEEEAKKKAEEEQKQKNSFSMLYYLAITAEDIRTSKDNRLMLDDIYTSLLNDINPGAIDDITQDHLQNLRDIIKSYLSISTKRERLQFIYNQNKAAAMRSAVPNPLAILSMANSLDWKKLAMTAVYTVVDSYKNYKNASESADTEFLMSGWELDDEELETIQKNRERAFNYMVDIVQEYNLDGMKTLSEKDIEKFSEICAIEAPAERKKRLEDEQDKYELLGNYWLELANCYFDLDKFKDCLRCVEKYNELYTGIYRQDANYVKILPKAIVSVQNRYKNNTKDYVAESCKYADAIVDNTAKEDWSTRYFAAQVYLDLYSRTNKKEYLNKAYKIASENVAVLLKGQRDLNNTYLADVKEQTVKEPDYRYMTKEEKKQKEKEYKEEKKRVKAYNDGLKKARKTELPTLYEPLVLNCELLFALADKMGIKEGDKDDFDAVLQADTKGIFIVSPINDKYSFSNHKENYIAELSKEEIIIPVSILTSGSAIEIVITEKDKETIIDDCKVSNVERKGKSVDEFYAKVTSKKWKDYSWSADSHVLLKIKYTDAYDKEISMNYKISEYEDHWYGDKVVFAEE
ncbi:hypothetical protein [Butyrivibrio sp. VCD2006]|uniref:hypothetical protein n=1 Tax=Butyrivibrio sp. VCD2006 TaxID=1280664 RepID=UPI000686AA4A|nr:hypothetical protein [Butyrivibrio sp. VCD2006]